MRRHGSFAWSFVVVVLAVATLARAGLAPDVYRALRESKYVYIQSERKTGDFGKAAEIWFYYDGSAVWVGTQPTSWRVRRIKAGRTKAHVAAGKPDGPGFDARGELRHDAVVEEKLMAEYARKYPDGWPQHAQGFREGFKSGERVLVRYAPK